MKPATKMAMDEAFRVAKKLGLPVTDPKVMAVTFGLLGDSLVDRARSEMSGEDFKAWRERLGLTRTQVSDILGVGRNQPRRYEEGQPIPKYIALACAAIAYGLPPMGGVR